MCVEPDHVTSAVTSAVTSSASRWSQHPLPSHQLMATLSARPWKSKEEKERQNMQNQSSEWMLLDAAVVDPALEVLDASSSSSSSSSSDASGSPEVKLRLRDKPPREKETSELLKVCIFDYYNYNYYYYYYYYCYY